MRNQEMLKIGVENIYFSSFEVVVVVRLIVLLFLFVKNQILETSQ
jgi:hypothetical protein